MAGLNHCHQTSEEILMSNDYFRETFLLPAKSHSYQTPEFYYEKKNENK